ncbi:MAG: alpha/beta hydrolase [Pseudomonadota bacterium]
MVFVLAVFLMALLAALFGGSAAFTAFANATWPPLGRFVEVEGVRLHVVTRGAKEHPAVLFLHGASGNVRDPLMALGERLSDDRFLIAVDRPGHGHSVRGTHADINDPATQARIIAGVVDALDLDRPLIVAHSMAGTIALNLALNHADRISGLVLLAPVSHPWPGGVNWYHHAFATPVFGPVLARLIGTPFGNLILPSGVETVFAPDRVVDDYIEAAGARLALRPATLVANGRDLVQLHEHVARDAQRYGQIDLPVTVISGDADNVVWTSIHTEGLRTGIAGARAIILPNAGHMPHHVAPDLVADEIRRMTAQGPTAD